MIQRKGILHNAYMWALNNYPQQVIIWYDPNTTTEEAIKNTSKMISGDSKYMQGLINKKIEEEYQLLNQSLKTKIKEESKKYKKLIKTHFKTLIKTHFKKESDEFKKLKSQSQSQTLSDKIKLQNLSSKIQKIRDYVRNELTIYLNRKTGLNSLQPDLTKHKLLNSNLIIIKKGLIKNKSEYNLNFTEIEKKNLNFTEIEKENAKKHANEILKNVILKSVYDLIKNTDDNKNIINCIMIDTPIYFKVDAMRIIIANKVIKNKKSNYIFVFANVNMVPMSREQLLGQWKKDKWRKDKFGNTLQHIKKVGLLLANNMFTQGDLYPFENCFFMLSNYDPTIVRLHKLLGLYLVYYCADKKKGKF